MAVSPVGSVGYYNATNFQGGKRIDPRHDAVFTDPKTGEKTTWKPGIYDPEAEKRVQERKSKIKKLFAFGALGVLAFIFRGKIKSGIDILKGLFKK